MRNMMRFNKRLGTPLICLLLLAVSCAGHLVAQEASEASKENYEVIALQYAQSNQVARAAMMILKDTKVSIVPDERTNSLIVKGSATDIAEFKKVLGLLDKKVEKEQKEPNTLRVYPLKYVEAQVASSVLQSTISGSGVRLTVDPKLNQVVLLGDTEAHQSAAKVLMALDQVTEQKREITKIYYPEDLPFTDGSTHEMLDSLADQHNVEFQYAWDLKLATVRGKADEVDDFLSVVDELERRQAKAASTKVAQAKEKSYAIRVVWLLASEESPKELMPEGLQEISRRAQKFGINNLKLVSQMLASTRVEGSRATDFHVSGPVRIDADSQASEFRVEGAISSIDGEATAFQLAVRFMIQSPGASVMSSGEMDMQLGVGKPVMVAVAPTELGQSIFAIEVIEQ